MLEHPGRLMAISILLLLFGFVMPFLMVLDVVKSTLFMNFFSFGASTLGLFLGIASIAMYRYKQKRHDDDWRKR